MKRSTIFYRRTFRNGSMFIYSCLAMVALSAITSLGVDLGHVQVVKTQLQVAADAAALAGADQLESSTDAVHLAAASSVATQTAALNVIDGSPTVLISSDIEIGNWDTAQIPSFSATRTPVNAVRVTAHRCASRNTAVPLVFGMIVGANSCDATASSIAIVPNPMSNYGIVGINHASFASLGVLARINGDIASDGDVSIGNPLGMFVSVTGSAVSYGGYVSSGSLASIGQTYPGLNKPLNYPAVVVPGSNSNGNIAAYLDSNSNFTAVGYACVPAGTYVVHDLNVLANLDLDLQGPVTFYVTGQFNLAASVNLLGCVNPDPANFTVKVASGGGVNFLGTILAPLRMNLYAPQSAINIAVGVNSFTGELIGQTLDINLPVLGQFTEVKPTNLAQPVALAH